MIRLNPEPWGRIGYVTEGDSSWQANFQLACRSRGLGTCLVTGHLNNANEIADIIGLPDDIGQAGLVAVGHITGDTNFRPAPRRPLDEVMHLNHWS
jgi:nitroreductase